MEGLDDALRKSELDYHRVVEAVLVKMQLDALKERGVQRGDA